MTISAAEGSLISDTDVLIVGAGPIGLVLALWLTRLGMSTRIVDRIHSFSMIRKTRMNGC